jgi:hypothetical protein
MQHSCFFLSCSCLEKQYAGFSCYSVTPLPENCCSTSLFTTGCNRLAEGDGKFFDGGGLVGGLLERMTLLVDC